MKNKIGKTIIVLLTVMALLTGIVPFASRTATAETTELQEGAVYRTGDKILLSKNKWVVVDDSAFYVRKEVKAGTYEVGRIYCPTVYIGSNYSWYIDNLFEVVGEDSKRDLCIGYYDPNKSDKEIFVTGIRCAGGTGEEGNPYFFKLIYEEKASLTITAIDQTYKFNGEIQGEGDTAYEDPALIAEKIDVKGLKGGDTIASVVLDGQGHEPGEYDLVPSNAVVYRDGENVTDRYNISYVNGKLIIEESEVKYPLWVGGKQVTSAYLSNTDEGWSYDPDSNILYLSNADITGTFRDSSCIYVATEDTLTISLSGNNKVTSKDVNSKGFFAYNTNLLITGEGSLAIDVKETGIQAAWASIKIKDTAVTISTNSDGVYGPGILDIDNSTVTVSVSGQGINLDGITITDSKVDVTAGDLGFDVSGQISISGDSYVSSNTTGGVSDVKYAMITEKSFDITGLDIIEPEEGKIANAVIPGFGQDPNYFISDKDGNIAAKAIIAKTYTIRFVDEDGTLLQEKKTAVYEVPKYEGDTPAKESDGKYEFTFKGWDKQITEVKGDATYTAVYDKTPIETPEPEPEPKAVTPFSIPKTGVE